MELMSEELSSCSSDVMILNYDFLIHPCAPYELASSTDLVSELMVRFSL